MSSIRAFSRVAFAILAIGTAACARGTAEKSNAQTDPLNAASPESPMPRSPSLDDDDPTLVAPPPGGTASEMDHGGGTKVDHGAGMKPATIYTCQMHPEVRLPAPGRCPRCGMKLVPIEEPDGGGR